MNTLTPEDGQLFYKLWLPLLDFVNRKFKIDKRLKSMATAKILDPKDVKKVADKLWENVQVIDEYLDESVQRITSSSAVALKRYLRTYI